MAGHIKPFVFMKRRRLGEAGTALATDSRDQARFSPPYCSQNTPDGVQTNASSRIRHLVGLLRTKYFEYTSIPLKYYRTDTPGASKCLYRQLIPAPAPTSPSDVPAKLRYLIHGVARKEQSAATKTSPASGMFGAPRRIPKRQGRSPFARTFLWPRQH